jgi:hypothetical protein
MEDSFIFYDFIIFATKLHGVWRSPVSAPGLGPGGRELESPHPDKQKTPFSISWKGLFNFIPLKTCFPKV